MCLFISSCVSVRCGSVPAGWVCPYRNTINTTMLNYWNIPERQWAPANVELSWDGLHHSAGPPHTTIDLTKVTYPSTMINILCSTDSQCGLCKYTYQWWGESVFLFISNKDLYLWVFIWFMCSYTREESCLYIHTFINTFIFISSHIYNISIIANACDHPPDSMKQSTLTVWLNCVHEQEQNMSLDLKLIHKHIPPQISICISL